VVGGAGMSESTQGSGATSSATSSPALRRREEVRRSKTARLERMVEIRLIEDRIKELFGQGLVSGTTHTAQGQEAVSLGIASQTLPTDAVCCTYRGHALALALGLTPDAVLGEILGRSIGCMHGLGGSMHLSDPDVGLLPTMAIVGAGIPIAAGAALSFATTGRDSVAVSVFGDGATNIGAFHEGLNLAAVWHLPAVFVCENNLYGEYSALRSTTPVQDLAVRAASYAMPSEIVDGQDLEAVEAAVGRAVARARAGEGPTFLEAKTYRYSGHSRSDKALYRPEGELERWQARDPIQLYAEKLTASGELGEKGLEEIVERQAALLEELQERVLASPVAEPALMFAHVLVPQSGR
jgi:TPP-dependent pyruvate/acetoin dehydrogenase alpha subunit